MNHHGVIARAIADAVNAPNRNGADVIANMSVSMFGEDDPESRFYRWIADAMAGDGLRAESEKLGLDVPEGEGFARRLRDAYLAKTGGSDGNRK